MKKLILLFIYILSVTSLEAAWNLPVSNFSVRNSNAGRQNWSIVQGNNGWLYFGNNQGLLEYNGDEWSVYKLNNLSIVRAINKDENGDIYVGGMNEFGKFAPDSLGRLSYTNLSNILPDSLSQFGEIWDIHINKNHIYIRSKRELFIFDKYDNFVNMSVDGLVMASCSMNNNAYLATTSGIYVIGEGAPISISMGIKFPYDQISALTDYGNGRLLIATSFDGLYIYENGSIKRLVTDADKMLKENQIFSITVGEKHIACGTVRGGVILMDYNGKNVEKIDLKGGLSNNTILSVMFDRDNNLWCGLDNGIDKVLINSPLRNFTSNLNFSGYCSLFSGAYLYMGTNQGLLRTLTNKDNEVPQMIKNSEGQVWNLQQFDDKIYCSHNRGLFILENENKEPRLRSIYSGNGVWSLIKIDKTRYLINTYEGIMFMQLDNSNKHTISPIDNYKTSTKNVFFHAPTKSCFVASSHGLEHVTFDDNFTTATKELILESLVYDIKPIEINGELIIYSPSQIYIVKNDGSLLSTDNYNYLFEHGKAYSMISIDENKNIWYEDENKLLCRNFIDSKDSYSNHIEQIFNDKYFFITGFTNTKALNERYSIINNIYGFSIVDSQWKAGNYDEPQPVIIGLYSTNKQDSLLFSSAYGIKTNNIELPYSLNSLYMIFGSDMVNDQTIEYSYKLRGNDDNWSKWSSASINESTVIHNRKEYTNLREGKYTFELRAKCKNGKIGESSLDIIIKPPLRRSNFMYCVYAITFILLSLFVRKRISIYYAIRRRQVEQEKEREIEDQKRLFKSKSIEQENNIIKLKNEKLESEVLAKSTELNNLLLNRLEKNDIISGVKTDLEKIRMEATNNRTDNVLKRILVLNKRLDDKMVDNIDWSTFEKNFNLLNNNFVQNIIERYSWMSINERKLCVYIKMGLQNKEIAPLLNLSIRGVEMLRYRIRKKIELDRSVSLYEFLQGIK